MPNTNSWLWLCIKVFSSTPLIHRSVTSYTIEDLKPDTLYQINIYIIPFPDQTTELSAEDSVEITTAIEDGKQQRSTAYYMPV